jgi:hypothetical protein
MLLRLFVLSFFLSSKLSLRTTKSYNSFNYKLHESNSDIFSSPAPQADKKVAESTPNTILKAKDRLIDEAARLRQVYIQM